MYQAKYKTVLCKNYGLVSFNLYLNYKFGASFT